MTQFAQVDDVGIVLLVQMYKQSDGTPLDISDASSLQIIYSFPDGTRFTKTASLYTDGIDGKLYFTTEEDDLPIAGYYSIQGKVVIGSAIIFSEVEQFSVLDNVLAPSGPPVPDPNIGTFTNASLAAGILTITHYKGLDAPYSIDIVIFDNAGHEIVPDQITGLENSVTIDLTSFVPLTGTWGYVYQ